MDSNDNFKNPKEVKKLSNGNLEFALNLYKTAVAETGDQGNLFCSPFSITAALCMTYAGARGDTADQMTKTMKLDATGSSEGVHLALGDIHKSLKLNEPFSDTFILYCANRMYVQESYDILNKFLAILNDHYGTEATKVDFVKNAEPTRSSINKWVEEVTRDKISDMLPQGVITADTRLILVNAIYFKGTWLKQFQESATVDDTFYRSHEDKSTVRMMHIDDHFEFFEDTNLRCKLLELPYSGDRLFMYMILPDAVDGLAKLEKQITPQVFSALRRSTINTKVSVSIPKFRMETSVDLVDVLGKMGISNLFDPARADLSGMNDNRELYVSSAIHKAFVEVNEEGTEAAAATALIVNYCCSLEFGFTFHANHPFLFVIYDHCTDLILFVGRLTNPA